jgi:hypothetical protein
MPFRLYDWQCQSCEHIREAVIFFPEGGLPPERDLIKCSVCDDENRHKRIISKPAKYMADRPLNPEVCGGSFDTMGYKSAPDLPRLPDGAGYLEYKDFFQTKTYKEAKEARQAVIKENKAKRKRAALLKQGKTINMREDKLPGDPKIAS